MRGERVLVDRDERPALDTVKVLADHFESRVGACGELAEYLQRWFLLAARLAVRDPESARELLAPLALHRRLVMVRDRAEKQARELAKRLMAAESAIEARLKPVDRVSRRSPKPIAAAGVEGVGEDPSGAPSGSRTNVGRESRRRARGGKSRVGGGRP